MQWSGYQRAFQTWQDALGRPVFAWARPMDDLDIGVTSGPPEPKPETMATTQRRPIDGLCKSIILLRQPMNEEQSYIFAVHELGHALGLDHNLDPSSFMHHELAWNKWESYRLKPEDVRRAVEELAR